MNKRTISLLTASILTVVSFFGGFACGSFSNTAQAAAPAFKPNKREMIERLKALKETQASELASLETAIRKQLQDSTTLAVTDEDVRFASAKAGMLASKLDDLNKRRAELNARREMVDRLIFAIDSKYSNQPIQQFLEQQFLEMASTDLSEARDSRMWKAFTYFSIAIREIPEPREDMFDVIESYMNFSSVLDPKTPAEFLASRNYTNGVESVAGRPAARETAGDEVADAVTASSQTDAAKAFRTNRRTNKGGAATMTLELRLPSKTVSSQDASSRVKTAANQLDTVSATTTGISGTVNGADSGESSASAVKAN